MIILDYICYPIELTLRLLFIALPNLLIKRPLARFREAVRGYFRKEQKD